jgi:hypothetical protein
MRLIALVVPWCIAAAAAPVAAANNCVDRKEIEAKTDQKTALWDALECLQNLNKDLEAKVAVLQQPPVRIAEPVPQVLGKWFQVPADGFLQIRVGGPGGAVADAWCAPEPNKGGDRVLNISGFTSDILLVRAGSWCIVERKRPDKKGQGVSAVFYALTAK